MAIAQKGSKFDLTVIRKLPVRTHIVDQQGARGGAPVGYVPPYAIPAQTPSAIRTIQTHQGMNSFQTQPLRANTAQEYQFSPVPVATPGSNPGYRNGTWANFADDAQTGDRRAGFGPPEQPAFKTKQPSLPRSNSDEFFSERELFFYKIYY